MFVLYTKTVILNESERAFPVGWFCIFEEIFMKKIALLVVLIGSMMMSACAVIPSNMAIFSPVAVDAVSPNQAFVNNNVRPLKRGEATQTGIILFSSGDASIEAAMKNGNITKVHHVDYKTTTVLFLYTKQTTIVYGE